MNIEYLGWSAFKIFNKKKTVLIDPFDAKKVGLGWEKQKADVVCVTHQHADHNYLEGVEGYKLVVDSPGEYEVEGLRINGIISYHDEKEGEERGFNTMYTVELDDFRVAHLGDLGQKLGEEQVEELGSVDILILPVGGSSTMNYEVAAVNVAQVEPAIVLPCHYQMKGVEVSGVDTVDKFLEEMGEEEVDEIKKLRLTARTQLPEETKVVLLELSV